MTNSNNMKQKSPWPTKAVMQQIYEKHFWGGQGSDFYSGEGSHKPEIIEPYLKAVISFLKSHQNLTVCDLGCGDFNIGKHLVEYTQHYFAVDIVPELIERNKTLFDAENLEFLCLDISKDQLPKADCVILRQVLQHLSNEEIQQILDKLQHYKYIILTEHIPIGHFTPNINIIANRSNRLKYNSGVDITTVPFNFKVKETDLLNEVILSSDNSKIITTLYSL